MAFTEKGERLIGQIAKRQAITNSANTIYAVKRLMGAKFDRLKVQRACQVCSYEITDAAKRRLPRASAQEEIIRRPRFPRSCFSG